MINLYGPKLPRKLAVACSGGIDSMAAVDFLKNNHELTLLFFDHGTETSAAALAFLQEFSVKSKLPLHIGNVRRDKHRSESWEEYWRIQRYEWFHWYSTELIVTGHHLDDCVETWIWSSMHGQGKLIPYSNKNVIRPFLINRKSELTRWAFNHDVSWIEDPSNEDTRYTRNLIRHELMPSILKVNPGIHTTIRNKLLKTGYV